MNKKSILIALAAVLVGLVVAFQVSKRTTRQVSVERTFNASIEKVWQHWNDPESIQKWWSPKGYTAPVIKNDLRESGTFLFSMKAPDGKVSWNSGKYVEVIEHKKIASKMAFSDEAGNMVPASTYGVPGNWPDAVLIEVEFENMGDKTKVKITETGIPLILYVFAKMGWEQQFDKFETLLN